MKQKTDINITIKVRIQASISHSFGNLKKSFFKNLDLIYFKGLMVSIFKKNHSPLIIYFAHRKIRSVSEDIAPVNKLSITLDNDKKNLNFSTELIQQAIRESASIKLVEETYSVYSSTISIIHVWFLKFKYI